jgi:hypothetical protein
MTSKKPQVGSNTQRDLDVIGADLRKLRNIFDSGELLDEARKQCKQTKTKWLPWLEKYFDGDDQTARNHMKAYDLSLKYLTVRDLMVPARTVYFLADLYANHCPKSKLSALFMALIEATKTKPICVAEADDVIRFAQLRFEHGDYPDATLLALEDVHDQDAKWAKKAGKALKEARPDTEAAAETIVNAHYRSHLDVIYGGALPDWLDRSMLNRLDDDDLTQPMRARVLKELQAAPHPLIIQQVSGIVYEANADLEESDDPDEQDGDADEPPETPTDMLPPPGDPSGETLPLEPKPQIKETDQAAAAAAAEAAGDVGGKAEIERLKVDVEALQNDKSRLQKSLEGRDREIKRLEDEVKKLKGDPSRLSIDKAKEALLHALAPVSQEKAELIIENLCKELAIDPHKLSTEVKDIAA